MQASEGFRSGGANQIIGLPTVLTPYEADSLWNCEIGAKTGWFGDKLVANLAAFRIDWQDMQVTSRTANGAATSSTMPALRASMARNWRRACSRSPVSIWLWPPPIRTHASVKIS